MKKFSIKAKVWRWSGIGGWHFVTLDKDLSAEIKKVAKPYGAGFVRIRVTLGRTSWETALFPHTKSKSYLISIKAAVRKKEDIWEGDDVVMRFVLV